MIIERSIRNAARVIRTAFAERIAAMEENAVTLDELIPFLDGERIRRTYQSGDYNDAIIYCGQSAGLINSIVSVRDIISQTASQAEKLLR